MNIRIPVFLMCIIMHQNSEVFVWTLDLLKRSCRKEHFALHLVYIIEDTCKTVFTISMCVCMGVNILEMVACVGTFKIAY